MISSKLHDQPFVNPAWFKKGLIFCPSGDGLLKTHASRPIPFRLSSKVLRIFFSSRDTDDRMLPTYIDVDIDCPSKILHVNECPLIEIGKPGYFDDSGITLASLIDYDDRVLLFYTGWKRRRVVSFEFSIGVIAWDRRNDTYTRLFVGPILSQSRVHCLSAAGPFVVRQSGSYRMWYCALTDWRFPNGNPEPIYTVYHAVSNDAFSWEPGTTPVIPYKFDGEVVSAPWVEKFDGGYLMWYSTRGHATKLEKRYSIGCAFSEDGINWTRFDNEVGIAPSESGWDSEMTCYPAIYSHGDILYMFYSGNDVGRSGFGYAIAENFMASTTKK